MTTENEKGTAESKAPARKPGVCIPWEQKRKQLPDIKGDEALFEEIWQDNEALAYLYIWHCLLSF